MIIVYMLILIPTIDNINPWAIMSECFIPFCFSSPFKSGVSMASRLCKAAMLNRFILLATEAKKDNLLKASTYHAAKVSH